MSELEHSYSYAFTPGPGFSTGLQNNKRQLANVTECVSVAVTQYIRSVVRPPHKAEIPDNDK